MREVYEDPRFDAISTFFAANAAEREAQRRQQEQARQREIDEQTYHRSAASDTFDSAWD
ncbi:hypothetical protein [Nocardia panacis]|uniref:hypothetical protein n=1 Tax=Nocardia panacis TaxID=2340916 RepID=UPI0013157FCA|nr:hypothetical protein [Nocardia panacis]